MATPLIPQEAYLLERYSSLAYFGKMRDEFAGCVKTAEDALDAFMRKLPSNYRSRPLFDQPDRAWGETVIPNVQWALRGLNNGYIELSHGEAAGLGMVGNVQTSFVSIARDFSEEWMPQPYLDAYDTFSATASVMSANISATEQASWAMSDLATSFTEQDRGPLDPPASWPTYRTNSAVRVKTDQIVPQSGVYLPDINDGCAQYLIKGFQASGCTLLKDPSDYWAGTRREPTTWTLVERIANSGGGIPGATDPLAAGIRLRCLAGELCPRGGVWFTPARAESRRHFVTGELMPKVGGDYGVSIWQWDEVQ